MSILTDKAPAYIFAAADLREQRAMQVPGSFWAAYERKSYHAVWASSELGGPGYPVAKAHSGQRQAVIEHIAAEANPKHALAEVRLWRSVAIEMEAEPERFESGDIPYTWTECARAALAYMKGEPADAVTPYSAPDDAPLTPDPGT